MGQQLGGLWDRVQGKPHLRKICDKVFDDLVKEKNDLPLDELHRAILLAYNMINKHFHGPHKNPPSKEDIDASVKALRERNVEAMDRDDFYQLILDFTSKDMRIVVMNKFILAILAALPLTEITKSAGQQVPKVRNVVEKIPTPAFVFAYTLGLVIVQDFNVQIA